MGHAILLPKTGTPATNTKETNQTSLTARKSLFIPTHQQLLGEIAEWKEELLFWAQEKALLQRLQRLSRDDTGPAGKQHFTKYNNFLQDRVEPLWTEILAFEKDLTTGEMQLLPLGNLELFENLAVRMKELKTKVRRMRLPLLAAMVKNYPIRLV